MLDDEEEAPSQRRHHRLSFVCVNDVYSFDDVDSAGQSTPRGGWARAATLMKQLKLKGQTQNHTTSDGDEIIDACSPAGAGAGSNDNDKNNETETTVLTVANGDVLGGCSLLQYTHGQVAIDVMNSIPIDIAVLGNHEFDYGDKALIERLGGSDFVWLGSNVYYPRVQKQQTASGSTSTSTSCLQEKVKDYSAEACTHTPHYYFPGVHGNGKIYTLSNSLKLGVFGLVTKVTPTISHPEEATFDPDVLAVARRTTQLLRAQGAQVIVAITHMSEEEDTLLAADELSGVDLILGGHEHEPLAKMVHRHHDHQQGNATTGDDEGGEPSNSHPDGDQQSNETKQNNKGSAVGGGALVFKCGMNAYWVGEVHLDITQDQNNDQVRSISTSWSMHAVTPSIAEDYTVSGIVKKCRKKTDESAMISNFGQDIAIDEVIATVGDIPKDAVINGGSASASTSTLPLDTRMSSVRRREATGGNLVADAMHWLLQTSTENNKSLPMLAMINGGFIRGDRLYEPGSIITAREILKELPFPRTMKVLEIDGLSLKEAMMQQLRGSSKGPTGAFPHVSSNARFVYQLDGGSDLEEHFSITKISVDGLRIYNSQKYLVAVTCFVADGNEGCSSWLKGTRVKNPAWEDINMSCVLLKYLQCHNIIRPALEDRVRRVQ